MHVHLDLVGGLAGDMFLAAAIDANLVDVAGLEAGLRTLGLGDAIRIEREHTRRGAIAGTHVRFVDWDPAADADHRHLSTIEKMIAASGLADGIKARATALFRILGAAEAKIHDIPIERVHFHEVGAVDSILDFVSAAWILEHLDATWSVGPIPTGRGTIHTAHGEIPVPAPATAELLTGMHLVQRDVEAELVTPTGAAILASIQARELRPQGRLHAIGYGCGTRDPEGVSNVVRLMAIDDEARSQAWMTDEVVRVETEIDDMSPELLADIADRRLPELGAVDVTRAPVHMKKGRIGTRITVLCEEGNVDAVTTCLLRETTTLGVRIDHVSRRKLARRVESVDTPWGPIAVKAALWGDEVIRRIPEYEACRQVAEREGISITDVFEVALRS